MYLCKKYIHMRQEELVLYRNDVNNIFNMFAQMEDTIDKQQKYQYIEQNGTPEQLETEIQYDQQREEVDQDFIHKDFDFNELEVQNNLILQKVLESTDSQYNEYLQTLPDNQRNGTSDFNMYRYWELNGKPKDFNQAQQMGMFTWHNEDKSYHAGSVAYDKSKDRYEFVKTPLHSKTDMELLDYFNSDELSNFRKNWKLNMDHNPYLYERRKEGDDNLFANGGLVNIYGIGDWINKGVNFARRGYNYVKNAVTPISNTVTKTVNTNNRILPRPTNPNFSFSAQELPTNIPSNIPLTQNAQPRRHNKPVRRHRTQLQQQPKPQSLPNTSNYGQKPTYNIPLPNITIAPDKTYVALKPINVIETEYLDENNKTKTFGHVPGMGPSYNVTIQNGNLNKWPSFGLTEKLQESLKGIAYGIDYLQSEGYKQRLDALLPELQRNFDEYYRDANLPFSYNGDIKVINKPFEQITVWDIPDEIKGSSYYFGKDNTNKIIMGNESQPHILDTDLEQHNNGINMSLTRGYDETAAHEFGHFADKLLKLDPSFHFEMGALSKYNKLKNRSIQYSDLIPEFKQSKSYRVLDQIINSGYTPAGFKLNKDKIEQFNNGNYNVLGRENSPLIHDSKPSESYGDLMQMRYLLYKYGVFDSRLKNAKFNQEMLDQFREKLKEDNRNLLPRLMNNFEDQQIINMINKIAQRNSYQNNDVLQLPNTYSYT